MELPPPPPPRIPGTVEINAWTLMIVGAGLGVMTLLTVAVTLTSSHLEFGSRAIRGTVGAVAAGGLLALIGFRLREGRRWAWIGALIAWATVALGSIAVLPIAFEPSEGDGGGYLLLGFVFWEVAAWVGGCALLSRSARSFVRDRASTVGP